MSSSKEFPLDGVEVAELLRGDPRFVARTGALEAVSIYIKQRRPPLRASGEKVLLGVGWRYSIL